MKSKKLNYINTLIIVILLGLASRRYSHFLPAYAADHAGDALWAMMVYFGFRFLLVRKGILFAILLSFVFSFGIEISQLYQAEWINQIRGTLLGALILGHGFLPVDLIRYTAGIIIAAGMDRFLNNSHFEGRLNRKKWFH